MQEISRKIGEQIKMAREEKGLTQKELGDYLGYSAMGISHFEQGAREVKISDVHKLADFFGKDVSFFLSPSLTMFRGSTTDNDRAATTKSLTDFEKYLEDRNK